MATVDKNFRIKNGIVVEGSTATVNGHDVLTEALVDAKGDLLVASSADAVTRLAAGQNGYILTANSEATNGVEWAAPLAVGSFETSITFEGATANDNETTLQVTDPTEDRIITLPDATGTIVLKDTTDTLTNKSVSLSTNTITGTLAEFNTALSDDNFVSLAGTETLTNKTLTSPVINTPTGITKTDVGLANVDNTSDADKPVSTATQTALDLKAPLASPTFTGTVNAADLTLSGNLTVNGTTTNLNSTNLVVEDKNIILGDTETPSDATADGGGITLKGTTDKTFNWVDTTDSWTSSEHINLASGKSLKLNGTDLKDVAETLTNKTLTSPVVDGTGVVFEGATANDFETTLSVADPTADRTITLPDVTGTVITTGDTGSVTNTMLAGSIANDKLANSGITINGTSTALGGTRTLVTDDIAEDGSPTNLYFTGQRAVDALQAVVPDFTAVEVNNISKQVAATVSLTDANATTAFSWAKADYRAAKFLVKFAYSTHTEVSEVLLTLDTSDNIGITEYAAVTTNGSLGDVTADISGSDVRLRVTAGTATTTCHVVGTLIR